MRYIVTITASTTLVVESESEEGAVNSAIDIINYKGLDDVGDEPEWSIGDHHVMPFRVIKKSDSQTETNES